MDGISMIKVKFKDLIAVKQKGCAGCEFACSSNNTCDTITDMTNIDCSDGYIFKRTVKTFPVDTPVTTTGSILFANEEQGMAIKEGGFLTIFRNMNSNCSDSFVWVKCERGELKENDTAFRTDLLIPRFSEDVSVCKIVDSSQHWYVHSDGTLLRNSVKYANWYKLTRKSDIN